MDADDAASGSSRSEDLRFNSAVAVNPGVYKVVLVDRGHEQAKTDLVALNRESYVVMRTGVDAERGPSYNEEIVVYPRSSVLHLMHSGAGRCRPLMTIAIVMMSAFVHGQ